MKNQKLFNKMLGEFLINYAQWRSSKKKRNSFFAGLVLAALIVYIVYQGYFNEESISNALHMTRIFIVGCVLAILWVLIFYHSSKPEYLKVPEDNLRAVFIVKELKTKGDNILSVGHVRTEFDREYEYHRVRFLNLPVIRKKGRFYRKYPNSFFLIRFAPYWGSVDIECGNGVFLITSRTDLKKKDNPIERTIFVLCYKWQSDEEGASVNQTELFFSEEEKSLVLLKEVLEEYMKI